MMKDQGWPGIEQLNPSEIPSRDASMMQSRHESTEEDPSNSIYFPMGHNSHLVPFSLRVKYRPVSHRIQSWWAVAPIW